MKIRQEVINICIFHPFVLNRILLHCKYIRPDYDGTPAIHSSSTMIPRRDQLQCKIWKFLIQNSITQDQQEGQNTIFKIVKITI